MLADLETMSYNDRWGGTIAFPPERWDAWADRWLNEADGRYAYRYLQDEETGEFLGEAAYHYDRQRDVWLADIVVYAPFRGKGYGRQGLELLMREARKNGLSALYDDMLGDNPALGMFMACGFTEVSRDEGIVTVRTDLTAAE